MSAYVTSNPVDRYLCPSPPPIPFTTTSGSDLLPVTLNSLSHVLFSSIRLNKERERTLSLTHLDKAESLLFHFLLLIEHTKNYQERHQNGIECLHGTMNPCIPFIRYCFRSHHSCVYSSQSVSVSCKHLSFSCVVLFKSVETVCDTVLL